MKIVTTLAVAAALSLGTLQPAAAAEFTRGTVKKFDAKGKKVTLIHEELKALDMPAMTMVFRIEDGALLEKFKEGASIEFVAERLNGKLVVTEVK